MLRRLPPLLGALLLAGGCGAADPPEVAFAAGGSTVTAGPSQYCDIALTECVNDAAAAVELAVPVGTPLRVGVPAEISATPWTVVFGYRRAAGDPVDARGPLFGPGERTEYVLELPEPADRLLTAQVHQFGPPPRADAVTGEIRFPVRATWVLTATG